MSFFEDWFAFSRAEVVEHEKGLLFSTSERLGIRMSENTEWGQCITILG